MVDEVASGGGTDSSFLDGAFDAADAVEYRESSQLAIASLAMAIQELTISTRELRAENIKMRAMLTTLLDPRPGELAAHMAKIKAYLMGTDTK